MSSPIDLVIDCRAQVAESPVWCPDDGQLLWVDVFSSQVNTWDATSGNISSLSVPANSVGSAAPRQSGGYVVAAGSGFLFLDADGTASPIATVNPPGIRMNDGRCSPDGSFWAGSMDENRQAGAGSVFRLDPEGSVSTALRGTTISNGIAFAPDGKTMFFVDTPTRRIDRFTVTDDGELRDRAVAVALEPGAGNPDGIALDDEGLLWVAQVGSGLVCRYTPEGRRDASITLPTARVTSCCFGGFDGRTLFVTTARKGLSPDELAAQPHAGGIFATTVGTSGTPPRPFSG